MIILRWALLLISVVIYRVWFPDYPPYHQIRFDYDVAVIIMIGLYKGPRVGVIMGWLVGFLAYATNADQFVWTSLLGGMFGWLIGQWRDRLFLEQFVSRWIVFAIGILAYKLLHWVIVMGAGGAPWYETLGLQILPTVAIDATLTVVLCSVWERIQRSEADSSQSQAAEASKH